MILIRQNILEAARAEGAGAIDALRVVDGMIADGAATFDEILGGLRDIIEMAPAACVIGEIYRDEFDAVRRRYAAAQRQHDDLLGSIPALLSAADNYCERDFAQELRSKYANVLALMARADELLRMPGSTMEN